MLPVLPCYRRRLRLMVSMPCVGNIVLPSLLLSNGNIATKKSGHVTVHVTVSKPFVSLALCVYGNTVTYT